MTSKCAIFARVSTTDQHAENQLDELRAWAERRGLAVAAELITEDSAWQNGNGKGAEFDRKRAELVNGARLGHYSVVLVWALDRLSRKGILDTLGTLTALYDIGAEVWSHQEPWLVTSEPRMRELLVSFMAWMAEQESARRSARVKLAMQRPEVKARLSARKPRGGDKRKRSTGGYSTAWTPERKAALAERNRSRAARPGE
jgi:DNA invertase Pin-like site-specific DNA recombinase